LAPPSACLDPAALVRAAGGLLVFDRLRAASPVRELIALLLDLATPAADPQPRSALGPQSPILQSYGALFRALAEAPRLPGTGALAAAVADAVVLDENVVSRRAEHGRAIPAALQAAAAADLRALQALAASGPRLPAAVAEAAGLEAPPPWWDAPPDRPPGTDQEHSLSPCEGAAAHTTHAAGSPHPNPRPAGEGTVELPKLEGPLAARLAQAPDWGALVPELAVHYRNHGSGVFARYRAFRWIGPPAGASAAASGVSLGSAPGTPEEGGGDGGAAASRWLVPVPVPDPVRPGDLIGYEPERALLRRNTVQFLAGFPANNVLLYGDRGTGKSSSVKALLHEAGHPHPPAPSPSRGEGESWHLLRLIEVPKGRLGDFPLIVALLRGRPQRFILFVDDLSFEDTETQYKELKAVLEGGLEARPANVVVYATSNRRHLVREPFADRAAPGAAEVHARDTMQEKLSFADRFGLTITFPTPDQASYLAIVEGLARQRALPIEPAALRARALEWAAWHNGRSGRTARQFVDHLTGELGLAAQSSK
jgi:predicted AAA+ superfamily ATPase